MKKIISGLVSLVMVLSLLIVPITAQAALEVYNPDAVPYYWTFYDDMSSTSYFAQSTKAEARTGDTSLVVYNQSNSWKYIVNNINYEGGKTYDVTLYVKGAHAPSNFQINFNYDGAAALTLASFVAEDAGDGWTKYTAEMTPSADGSRIFLMSYGCSHVYIDDFSIVQRDNGQDYIVNGSFDFDYKRPYDESVKNFNWSAGVEMSDNTYYHYPTDFDAYEGKKSLIASNTSADKLWITQSGRGFEAGKNYKVTLYTKGNFNPFNVGLNIDYHTEIRLSECTSTPAADGWTKLEGKLNPASAGSRLFIVVYSAECILIDNFSIIDTTTGAEMLVNGSFEDIYYTTAQNKASTPIWTMPDTEEFAATATNYFETSVEDSSDGDGKSLFVSYTPSASGQYVRIENTQLNPYFLTSEGKYEISLSVKGEYSPGSILLYTNAWEANRVNGAHTVTDLGNGWTRYSVDLDVTKDAGSFWLTFDNAVNIYIDDITITPKPNGVLGTACTLGNADFSEGINALSSENPKLPANWTFTMPTYTDEGAVYGENYFGEISSDAKSGNSSMKIALPYYEAGKYAMIRQNVKINAGEEYDVSFWLKGDFAPINVEFHLGNWDTGVRASQLEAVETVNGWTKYSGKMTAAAGGDGIWFMLFSGSSLFIDDVIVSGENGVNQVINSGFEDNYDVKKTGISNVLIYPVKSGTSTVISWQNPDVDVLDYKVYTSGGTMAFTPNLAANGYNECVLTDLITNGGYNLAVEITTEYGIEQQTIQFVPHTNTVNLLGREYLGAWTFANGDGATKYANAEAEVDFSNYSEGEASFRITTAMTSAEANCFASLSQRVVLNTRKDYKLTFDAKLVEAKRPKIVRTGTLANGTAIAEEVVLEISEQKDNGWVTFEGLILDYNWDSYDYLYDAEDYQAKLELMFSDMLGTMYVDNFAVVEVDEYGEVIGTNILEDEGFEFEDYYVEDAVFTQIEGDEEFELDAPANGTITVSRRVEAYKEDMDVIYYVALYKGNVLKNAQTMASTVKKGAGYETFSFDVTIDDEDLTGYSIKTFVWDSNMKPWADVDGI